MTKRHSTSLSRVLKACVFSLIPGLVLFAGVELTLRTVNFKFSPTPMEMHTLMNNPSGVVATVLSYNNRDGIIHFIKDARQHWVPKDSPLKRHSEKKTPGVLRIATLGDSCTAGCTNSSISYPDILEKLLLEQGMPAEVLNAGVGSYSSYQGLQRLKYAVLPYQPDILTIYFGWNDHWITGTPDSAIKLRSDFEIGLINFFENFRIFQALNYLHSKFLTAPRAKPSANLRLRVSAQEYLENLQEIVRIAREHHMRPILITAPNEIDKWDPAASHVYPFPKEKMLETHEYFISLVRQVAREQHVELFDLEKIVKAAPAKSVLSSDGIHFHESGCTFVAQKLAEFIRRSTPEIQPN